MDPGPETEYGSAPSFVPGDWRDQTNVNNMSISELVSELRATFLASDFDRVEEALVAREARLKAEIEAKKKEIGSLQEEIVFERLERINAEEELKNFKREKGKAVDDGDANAVVVAELRKRICEVEGEKVELVEEKKRWVDERGVIAELRAENRRLKVEKGEAESMAESLKRKFCELDERVLRLESGGTKGKVLVNGDGNTEGEPGVGFGFGGNVEKEMMEIYVRGDAASSKRNEDVSLSFGAGTGNSPSMPSKDGLGASASGRLEMGNVDSQGTLHRKESTSRTIADNEHPSPSGAVQKNLPTGLAEPIGILKREFASSHLFGTNINILDGLHSDASSSSSSSGSLDFDNLPLSSLTSNKKMRTDATSPSPR